MDEPLWLWPALAAPFIGSFVGLLVNRLPQGRPVIGGRSVCDRCGHVLGPIELVPVVSWLALRGRCRHCGGAISPLSTCIEIGCVMIAIWAASVSDNAASLWASCALGWPLLALAVIDFRDGILPDVLTVPLLVAGLTATYFLAAWQFLDCVAGAFAGFAAFALIRWVYRHWRGREGLGLGDAKLLAASGAWVSWNGLPSVVLIAALLGLIGALAPGWRGARLALDERLPFGPALCLATWLIWLYGPIGSF